MGRKKALCPELLGPWLALERDPSTFRLQNLTVDCCSLPAAGQAESKRSKLLSSFWYFFKRYVIIYKALVRNHCICVLSFVTLCVHCGFFWEEECADTLGPALWEAGWGITRTPQVTHWFLGKMKSLKGWECVRHNHTTLQLQWESGHRQKHVLSFTFIVSSFEV